MLPVNYGGHTAYQDTFVSRFLALFPNSFAVPKQTWDIIVKFWYLDLSETDTIMQEFYPLTGKPATRFPSCLLRSYLLSIVMKVDSITGWCRLLKITPLYAILSGFPPHDTLGVGTFYDFFNRLWQSDKDNYIHQVKHKKAKPEKGKKRGDKTSCDTESAAAKLLPLMQRIHLPDNNPFYLIFRLYKAQFLDVSVRRGLINSAQLSLAGEESLLKPQGWNVPKGFAVFQKALPVDANGSFHSLTATGDGILPEINIFLATIFTCLLLPVPKMTFPFFQCLSVLPGMTCCPSCILFPL